MYIYNFPFYCVYSKLEKFIFILVLLTEDEIKTVSIPRKGTVMYGNGDIEKKG